MSLTNGILLAIVGAIFAVLSIGAIIDGERPFAWPEKEPPKPDTTALKREAKQRGEHIVP